MNPSLGTKEQEAGAAGRRQVQEAGVLLYLPPAHCYCLLILSGRDSSRQNGDCAGAWSSKRRVGLTPRPDIRTQAAGAVGRSRDHCRLLMLPRPLARVPGIGLLNRTPKSWAEGMRFNSRGLPQIKKIRCGVAQAGKSVRLINERLRVRIPPPRPNSRSFEFPVTSFEFEADSLMNSKPETRNQKLF